MIGVEFWFLEVFEGDLCGCFGGLEGEIEAGLEVGMGGHDAFSQARALVRAASSWSSCDGVCMAATERRK